MMHERPTYCECCEGSFILVFDADELEEPICCPFCAAELPTYPVEEDEEAEPKAHKHPPLHWEDEPGYEGD